MEDDPEHIIFISLDTMRGDCFGEEKYRHLSPGIRKGLNYSARLMEELASEGIYFKNCFTVAPFTTASHASLFTGFLPLHHGVFEYFNSDMKKPTVFEYANEAGYETLFQTDFPIILGQPIGFTRGIQHYFIENESGALEQLRSKINSKTCSLFHFGGIHYPYGFHTLKFGGEDYRRKVNELEAEFEITSKDLPRDQFDETYRDDEDKALLFRYKRIVEYLYAQKNYRRLTELYLEGVDYFLEHRLRSFIEKLRALLEGKRYRVILFGDHGEDWSEESKGHYKSLTAGVLNVPLIIIGNDLAPQVIDTNVQTIDIAPTILRCLGISPKEKMDGLALDLYNISESLREERTSIAQVWLGVGKQELISHIEKAHRDQGFSERMQTVKRGESALRGQFQLIRRFDKEGVLEEEKLISLTGAIVPEGLRESLLSDLEVYEDSASEFSRKDLADDAIKEQFRLLGYNI